MGNLLGAPVTEKETHVGTTPEGIPYGVSSMQGWRVHMEDAHITQEELYAIESNVGSGAEVNEIPLDGHSLFAVFDGHGGTFAAMYSGRNFCRVLSRQPKFVDYGNFSKVWAESRETMPASGKAQYVQNGLGMLEAALRDAFVEIDKEIALALQGSHVPDTDTPYHSKISIGDTDTENGKHTGSCGDATTAETTTMNSEKSVEGEGDSGTTACVVVVTPEWIICANAGDSRSVFSRSGTKVVPLSYDHKPDDDEEQQRIRAAGGYVAGGRVEGDLAVSRGLGDYRFKRLDVVLAANSEVPSLEMKPGDQKVSPIPDIMVQDRDTLQDEFIIIACDGIWDVQTNYEAVKTVSQLFQEGESNIGLICEEMLDCCLDMGSKDNMTALVIKFDGQTIGQGGGVLARRQLREAEEEEHGSNASM